MKFIRPLLLGALALTLLPTASVSADDGSVPGEVVLRVEAGTTIASNAEASGTYALGLNALFRQVGATSAESLGAGSNTYVLRTARNMPSAIAAHTLARHVAVAYAEPNATRQSYRSTNDPILRQQWALRNIQAFEAWDITTGGEIVVAVLDTGVSASHPDLGGKVLPGYDFHRNDSDASDENGHGTYTAGVIAANADNGTGIAGVCWGCKILPVRVLGASGNGDDARIAAGIRWAADQGVRIVNMSLGGPEDTQVMREAVQYARQRGTLLIAASGNGQAEGNVANYPAAYPEVLAVSATDGSDVTTGFTTTGRYVDIAAPGVGVWSTAWDPRQGDTYTGANGTSAAAPYVAGIAALVMTIRPDLNAEQVAEVLVRSADEKGAPGKDSDYGYGRVNAFKALQYASNPNLTLTGGILVDDTGTPAPAPAAPAGGAPAFAPIAGPSGDALYFPETQHSLRGVFRAYWQRHGGLPIFGFPISEEFIEKSEDGRDYTVQYFERHRFEYHPENVAPYDVLLSRLGDTTLRNQGRDWFSFPKGQQQADCQFFADTGHSVCGAFLTYWRSNGLEIDGRAGKTASESLALFGQPISEPQVETLEDGRQYTVQWFERARFEDHGGQVLLGLLSNDLARSKGYR